MGTFVAGRDLGIDFFDSVDTVVLDNMLVEDLRPIKDLRELRAFFGIMIEIDDQLDFPHFVICLD